MVAARSYLENDFTFAEAAPLGPPAGSPLVKTGASRDQSRSNKALFISHHSPRLAAAFLALGAELSEVDRGGGGGLRLPPSPTLLKATQSYRADTLSVCAGRMGRGNGVHGGQPLGGALGAGGGLP
jgi:hypothetical protein